MVHIRQRLSAASQPQFIVLDVSLVGVLGDPADIRGKSEHHAGVLQEYQSG
jgi:hypothetical protein